MRESVKKLFDNRLVNAIGAAWGALMSFLFPTSAILTASSAVLLIIGLDLITKLFALSRQNGGFRQAFKKHVINSQKFAKGTIDKLIIFGTLLILSGCAYNILVVDEIAVWFTQIVFSIMFLRDTLSVLENLHDAGISGLSIFKKIIRKKLCEYTGDESKPEDINEEGVG